MIRVMTVHSDEKLNAGQSSLQLSGCNRGHYEKNGCWNGEIHLQGGKLLYMYSVLLTFL